MSNPIDQLLRAKEQEEMRVTSQEESFREDAVAKLSECLLHGGDLHNLIEELSSAYWDIFFNDLENSDINLYITEAVAYNIRSVS